MTKYKTFPVWIVATHFLNIAFTWFMGRSGLEILSAFPKFYLSADCPPGKESLRLSHNVVSADSAHPWTSLDEEEPWNPLIGLDNYSHLASPRADDDPLYRRYNRGIYRFWMARDRGLVGAFGECAAKKPAVGGGRGPHKGVGRSRSA